LLLPRILLKKQNRAKLIFVLHGVVVFIYFYQFSY